MTSKKPLEICSGCSKSNLRLSSFSVNFSTVQSNALSSRFVSEPDSSVIVIDPVSFRSSSIEVYSTCSSTLSSASYSILNLPAICILVWISFRLGLTISELNSKTTSPNMLTVESLGTEYKSSILC